MDSCDMCMQHWSLIAQDIKQHYDYFDSFVVLHGTDTMAYTASALSYMLENLDKTVVITGSQVGHLLGLQSRRKKAKNRKSKDLNYKWNEKNKYFVGFTACYGKLILRFEYTGGEEIIITPFRPPFHKTNRKLEIFQIGLYH